MVVILSPWAEVKADCLMLGHDNVTLSKSRQGLLNKINALAEYFKVNDLTVNLGKTKAMIFRRGGLLSHAGRFTYRGQPKEIVSTYTYLAIVTSYTGIFRQAYYHRISKARVAISNALSLCKELFDLELNTFTGQ